MATKIIVEKDKLFECPVCGYRWEDEYDLAFDEGELVPCCPDCGELIEDGGDGAEYEEYGEAYGMDINSPHKIHCDSIMQKAKELKALLPYDSNSMMHLNKDRALSALSIMQDSINELKLFIESKEKTVINTEITKDRVTEWSYPKLDFLGCPRHPGEVLDDYTELEINPNGIKKLENIIHEFPERDWKDISIVAYVHFAAGTDNFNKLYIEVHKAYSNDDYELDVDSLVNEEEKQNIIEVALESLHKYRDRNILGSALKLNEKEEIPMKVKIFRFLVSNPAYRADDYDKSRPWYEDHYAELDGIEKMEDIINNFIEDVEVVDVKTNTVDVNYHNNGGNNTIELVYTILYK